MPGRESENSVRSSLAIPDNPPGGKEKSEQGGRREGEEEGGCGGVGWGGGHRAPLCNQGLKSKKGLPRRWVYRLAAALWPQSHPCPGH